MHADGHSYTFGQIQAIEGALDAAGVGAIEVAHGGRSSVNYGHGAHSGGAWIEAAVSVVRRAVLAALLLPGIGTIDDLRCASPEGAKCPRNPLH